jgi:calcium-dependent protein kinase
MWSCGVILYILLSARPPFGGENDTEIMARVAKGKYDLKSPPFDSVSKEGKDLIKSLLVMEPAKRLSAEKALAHPWLKINQAKQLFNQIKSKDTVYKLVENLKNYHSDSVIQETALAYLVHNFPQSSDVINACKLFNLMDVSGDGKINQKELLQGLRQQIQSDTLEQDVAKIYKNLDMDNNGYIEYEEFVRAAVNKERFLNEGILRFAFRYFDKDNSGEIDFNEIEEVFKQSITDKNKVHESLKKIINEVDQNGDNKIDFNEFVSIMKKMIKKN